MNIPSELTLTELSKEDRALIKEIEVLKKEKNAIILAHFYQRPEIQDIADKVGDSLELARFAYESNASVILLAGVVFMAETAKILNPNTKVLVPDFDAGCGLADSCSPEDFKEFIDQNSDRVVVSYINTYAEIKAMSDVICTSSNAISVIEKIPKSKKILFAPDKNLGRYVQSITGRDILCWDGVCYVHEAFSIEKIARIRKEFPDALILAHPESEADIIEIADFVGSTSAMIKHVQNSEESNYIIATEGGIIHDINKKINGKKVLPAPTLDENSCACSECSYMKLNTLKKIHQALKLENTEIKLSDSLIEQARIPLLRMISAN